MLGGRELLRRRWLLSGVCVCTAATFSVRSRAPRSTRSPACAGWRSRECVDSTNLALERHLNARHGPRETSNRAWAGVGAVLVHGLLARPPINSRSFCRSWLRSRPVPAGLCLGAAGQRPETSRLHGSLGPRSYWKSYRDESEPLPAVSELSDISPGEGLAKLLRSSRTRAAALVVKPVGVGRW